MKAILIIIGCISLAASGYSQTKPGEDSLLEVIQKDICESVSKSKATDFTAQNFQMKFGMIFLGSLQKQDSALTALYGTGYLTDQTRLMDISQKIAMNMAFSCPAFQELVMGNPEIMSEAMKNQQGLGLGNPKTIPVEPEKEYTSEKFFTASKLVSFTAGELSFFTIQEKGKSRKIYWMGNFEGDEDLIANPRRYLGKKMNGSTKEIKIYDARTRKYKKVDVIVSLLPEELN